MIVHRKQTPTTINIKQGITKLTDIHKHFEFELKDILNFYNTNNKTWKIIKMDMLFDDSLILKKNIDKRLMSCLKDAMNYYFVNFQDDIGITLCSIQQERDLNITLTYCNQRRKPFFLNKDGIGKGPEGRIYISVDKSPIDNYNFTVKYDYVKKILWDLKNHSQWQLWLSKNMIPYGWLTEQWRAVNVCDLESLKELLPIKLDENRCTTIDDTRWVWLEHVWYERKKSYIHPMFDDISKINKIIAMIQWYPNEEQKKYCISRKWKVYGKYSILTLFKLSEIKVLYDTL